MTYETENEPIVSVEVTTETNVLCHLNADIAIPEKLTDLLGRQWGVTSWSPTVAIGEPTRATAKLVLLNRGRDEPASQ